MNKNKMTHEEARNILFGGNNPELILSRRLINEELLKLTEYIKQQEKQEKLLELCKELDNVIQNKYNYSGSVGLIDDLRKQIKVLEDE